MLAPLAWSSFVCPACKVQLDVTKLSQSLIILSMGALCTLVAWLVSLAGMGGITSVAAGAVTLLVGVPWGLGTFAQLSVHSSEHPSLVS